jgi:c-di-GMP-binding flagellar brake protein YcgR
MKNVFRIGQKLDVVEINPETQEQFVYLSRIEDVTENSLFITPPFRRGFYLPPHMGREITGRVTGDGCAHVFQAKLLANLIATPQMWEISMPTRYERIQLREYVRLDIALNTKLVFDNEQKETKEITALTKDISSGGMRVMLLEKLPLGQLLEIALIFDSLWTLVVQGKVVRVVPPQLKHEKYGIGVQFLEISEKTKNRILRFIFSKQAERRQKEKKFL